MLVAAAFVQFGDRQEVEREIVGQKDQAFAGVGVLIADPAQRRRIILRGARTVQQDGLIAAKIHGFVHRCPAFTVLRRFLKTIVA